MTQSPLEVYIRFRPATKNAQDIQVEPNKQNMTVINPVNKQKVAFTFNQIFQNASQEEIYSKICERSVKHVLQGYNACVMATGQTSAGKSYSIIGDETLAYKTRGMVSRALEQLFDAAQASPGTNFQITFSAMEIINERINDLIKVQNKDPFEKPQQVQLLEQQDGKLLFKNLQQIPVQTVQSALELLFTSENHKKVAETAMNANSSRSHVVYVIQVAQSSRTDESAQKMLSKLYLVDLAGSEKSNNSFINKSLQNLQICIQQLARENFHVPFRASKLTQVLRDCLGGSSKTAILGCIRGEQDYIPETLQTLRFCQEAVNIKTDASVNIVNRIFEDKQADQRAVNSQITQAILEAAQQRGGIESLQSKVMRELEQENKKLKAEIMLLSGQQAQFTTDQNKIAQLKQSVDLWLQDAGTLPALQSRVDYEEILAYLKYIIQQQRKQGFIGTAPVSPVQAAPNPPPKEEKKSSRPQSKNNTAAQPPKDSKDKKAGAPVELPALFGTVQNNGAIAVGTVSNIAAAAQLSGTTGLSTTIPINVETSPAIDTNRLEYDENAKFDQYRATDEGARLVQALTDERRVKIGYVNDLRAIKENIAKLTEQINECQQQIRQKIEKLNNPEEPKQEPQAGKKGAQHNIINYNKNQLQEAIMAEIHELKEQITKHQADIQEFVNQSQGVKQQIEQQKVVEERARRKLMTGFEGYCAGLYKKMNEIKQEQEEENQMYAQVLGRTRKPRKPQKL